VLGGSGHRGLAEAVAKRIQEPQLCRKAIVVDNMVQKLYRSTNSILMISSK
jgi:hypothetical protein